MIINFCEFTGDDEHYWDECGYKKSCQYLGFRKCALYDQPLEEHEGWRVCCKECGIPVQSKEVYDDTI